MENNLQKLYCDCFLKCTNFKDDLTNYRCLFCYENYKKSLIKT